MASFQDTGNCLFCWDDVFVESDLRLSPDLGKFLKCLGSYLGVLKWRDKEEEAIDFGGNVGVDTCQGCGRMIMRFVELFGELCRIRLEIDAGLEVLVGKMRGIEGTEEDNQENGLEGVKKLRAEIRDKCFKKVSKAQAKVCLEKLKLQTANLEVGAGVMEKGLENEDDSDDHSNNFDVEFNEEIGLEVDVEVKFCPEETEKEKGDKKDTEWKPDTTTRYWSISTSAKVLTGR